MKGILTVIIFGLMMAGVGGPLVMLGFLILGYISQSDHIGYWDLDWYYHLGYLLYIVLLLKILFNVSRSITAFILSFFK